MALVNTINGHMTDIVTQSFVAEMRKAIIVVFRHSMMILVTSGKIRRTQNKSSLYSRYKHMIWRCNNPNCKDYDNYGGRGIKVCKEWLDDYKTFKQWAMDNGYEEHLTIDRIDVNGNYEPDNCRWITLAEQENNRRDNVYLTYQGITKTASQWSKLLGIKPSAIYYLKRKQLSDDDIFRHFPQIAEVLKEMRGAENDE